MSGSSGLGSVSPDGPPISSSALEPAWVRNGSAATQKSYQSALAFEEMLVEQLSRSLTASGGLGGESAPEGQGAGEEGSAGAGAPPFSSMLPSALTSAVMSAGGIGLAAQMAGQLGGGSGLGRAEVAGGTAPVSADAGASASEGHIT